MADPMPPSPLPAPPSGEDFYSQASVNYAANEAARAARQAAPGPEAAQPVKPSTEELYAPYLQQEGFQLEVYKDPKSKEHAVVSLAQALAAREQNPEAASRVVSVFDPEGNRTGVKLGDLDAALSNGFRLESARDAQIRRELKPYEGALGSALVGGFKAADEVFLGVPGVIASHTGDDYERAKGEALLKQHETAGTVGSVAGFAGSLLVGAPIFKGAAKAGAAVAKGVEKALAKEGAETLGRTLLKSAATGAARMGTEAAVIAAPKAITEAALGDPEAAAETLLWSIGGGAVLGGVGAPAYNLLKRIPKTASTALVKASAGSSTAIDKLATAYTQARDPAERAALVRAYETAAGRGADPEAVIEKGIRSLTASGEKALKAEQALSEIAFMAKPEQMLPLIDTALRKEQRKAALEVWQETRKLIDFWKGTSAKGGLEGGVKRLDNWVKDFEKAIGPALDKEVAMTHPERAYILLDDLKRQTGKAAQFGKSMVAIPEASRDFDALYHTIRDVLERKDVWGQAANAQREVNAAYTSALSTRKKFAQAFTTEYGSNMGRPEYVFDPEKVAPYLDSLGRAKNDLRDQALQDYVAGMRQRVEAVEKNYGRIDGGQRKALDEGKRALEELEKTVETLRREAGEVNVLRKMKAGESASSVGPMGYLADVVAGKLGLGSLASAGSTVIDAVTKPVLTAERLGAASKFVGKLKSYGSDKLGILVSEQAMKRAGQELDRIPQLLDRMGVSKLAQATVPAHAMSRLLGGDTADRRSRDEQFKELSTKLAEFHSSIEQSTGAVAELSSVIAEGGAPAVAESYARGQLGALKYLFDTMPREPSIPAPFTKSAWKPTQTELLAWERRVETVNDPFSVFRHLESGTLSKEHVETLRRVYPKLYTAMVDRITKRAADPKAPVMPMAARQRLSALLGVPLGPGTGTGGGARFQGTFRGGNETSGKAAPRAGSLRLPDATPETARLAG